MDGIERDHRAMNGARWDRMEWWQIAGMGTLMVSAGKWTRRRKIIESKKMIVHTNDIIRFLDSVGGGKVIQVDEEKQLVWVETDDGFDVGPIPASSVVPVSSQEDYMHLKRSPIGSQRLMSCAGGPESQPHVVVSKRSQRQSNELVVDLHIEALPTNGSGMTDVEKHKYQLQYFRMQMQQNLRYRGRRLVIIHGKGNGVLKNEIRQILNREFAGKVEVHDADFSKYEEGATLVIIK